MKQRADPASPGRRARWPFLLGLLALAWALPWAAHLLGADVILPPLVLVATASLLRVDGLLGRLVLAAVGLIGIGCVAGLVWSVWPWGLHPAMVTGVALTLLVALAATTRRRPSLPRPRWTELVPVLGALAATAYLAMPYLRAPDFVARLSLTMGGEDNARHMTAFDVIGRGGAYLLLAPERVLGEVSPAMTYYPQGWHLTAALLDGFLPGPAATERAGAIAFDHYTGWAIAGYGFFILATIWAALRVAGPALHPLHQATVTVVVVVLCVGSDLPRLLASGYPSEVLGLTLSAALIALVVRPLPHVREQILLVSALLLGIGFTYYLFVIPAGMAALLWLIIDRKRVFTRRVTLMVVAVPTALLALLPAAMGAVYGKQADALSATGPQPYGAALLAMTAVIVAGLLGSTAMRRSSVSWRYGGVLLISLTFAAAFAVMDRAPSTASSYYFVKTLHLTFVTLILGVGLLIQLLPAPERAGDRPAGIRGWLAPTAVASLICVALVAAVGLVGKHGGLFVARIGNRETTLAQAWHQGRLRQSRQATIVVAVNQAYPAIPGTTTFLIDQLPAEGHRESLFLSALQRTGGQTADGLYGLTLKDQVARVEQILSKVPGLVRLIVTSPEASTVAERALIARPHERDRVTVVGLG